MSPFREPSTTTGALSDLNLRAANVGFLDSPASRVQPPCACVLAVIVSRPYRKILSKRKFRLPVKMG
jgi:hypothetical protein